MAIVGNQVTEVGDVLYIKTDVPAIGLLALIGFVDVTVGETEVSYFNKLFRYSIDGINYTDWIQLTIENIQAVPPFDANAVLFIQYRYQKVGSGLAEFDSATITATTQNVASCGYYFVNSFFSDFFSCGDIEVLGWYLNVTEKLYKKGTLAAYIGRTNDAGVPDDFIQFWKSVSKFFAYYVIYARKWQTFYQNTELLREYLAERGLETSIDTSLPDLVTLMNTYNQQMADRGTEKQFLSVRDNDVTIDGEVLRAIDFQASTDEFLFTLFKPELFGWNIGNSSPLYRGLQLNDSVNKFYELVPSDLSKYPLINGSNVALATDNTIPVISLGSQSGIGGTTISKAIIADPNTDYELSFLIKKVGSTPLNLQVNLVAFDINGNSISCNSFKTGTASNIFVTALDLPKVGIYYLIRCILYNSSRSVPFLADHLNIHAGNNLVANYTQVKIVPNITIGAGASAYLYNIAFRPLFTEFSRGFIQVNNFISCWLNDRNQHFDTEELEGWLQRYQIPYNAHIKVTQSGTNLYNVTPEAPQQFVTGYRWIGAQATCTYTEAPEGTFNAIRSYAILLQVDNDTGKVTGLTKANTSGDADYIPPATDLNACPVYHTTWIPVEDTAYCETD